MINEYVRVPPRHLIDMLRYALEVISGSSDEELAIIAPDLADGALSIIPAAELLEEREQAELAPARQWLGQESELPPSVTFRAA